MTDILETIRDTLADKLGVKVRIPDAEAVIDALNRAGVPVLDTRVDPVLVALTGAAGRAPGAYDDQAYRE